jgi:hypothetical protein
MGASEQDFRIFFFPFGGGLFCLLANLSGALHQYSPPSNPSRCARPCVSLPAVAVNRTESQRERMLDGQTQETAVMREEQEKIVITTWKQV